MIRVSSADSSKTWLGVEASGLNFALDFAPVSLAVTNGTLILNQASDGTKVNWSNITVGTTTLTTVTDQIDLSVSGDASLDVDGLLSIDVSFALSQQAAPATPFGADAKAIVLNLSSANGTLT